MIWDRSISHKLLDILSISIIFPTRTTNFSPFIYFIFVWKKLNEIWSRLFTKAGTCSQNRLGNFMSDYTHYTEKRTSVFMRHWKNQWRLYSG
jgi:hypothetical protein